MKFRRLRRDVYARPAPSMSVKEPFDLFAILPKSVAGAGREIVEEPTTADSIGVEAFYYGDDFEGEIGIAITRYSSAGAAASDLYEGLSNFSHRPGSTSSSQGGKVHWFTHTDSELSIFAWRKGVWFFVVTAPNEALRNQVVEELPF